MSLFTEYNPVSGAGSFESSNGTGVAQPKEISDKQFRDLIGNIVDSTHAVADAVDYATQTACDVANGTTQYHNTRRNIVQQQQCYPNQQNRGYDNVIDYSNIPYGYGGQTSRTFNYVNQQTPFSYNNNPVGLQNNNPVVGGVMNAPFGTKIY